MSPKDHLMLETSDKEMSEKDAFSKCLQKMLFRPEKIFDASDSFFYLPDQFESISCFSKISGIGVVS